MKFNNPFIDLTPSLTSEAISIMVVLVFFLKLSLEFSIETKQNNQQKKNQTMKHEGD